MRIKPSDGPLQAVQRNNDIFNSPKKINTIQNSNYTQITQTTNYFRHVDDVDNVAKNTQQLTIKDAAALNNGHTDTQELRWCNSELNTTDQQLQQLNINRLNINNTLAAQLRLRAQQNAPIGEDQPMPQSPDDILIDDDEAIQSCSSSVSASPQDENRIFDPSDSAESSDEGNDYTRNVRQAPLKGFINPNYPGFQHLAHTLDFDDELLNNANNNNNDEYEVPDKFDSINRLDSVENIQKVFHDKSLDLEVRCNASGQLQDSPNETNSVNCDSESEGGGTSDYSAESGTAINENFNIRIDETKLVLSKEEIPKIEDAKDNLTLDVKTKAKSVVGNFRKEVEAELKKHLDHSPPKTAEVELEKAVEKLQVISDLQPSASKCSVQPNTDEPFSKELSLAKADRQNSKIINSSSKENIISSSMILQQKKEETLARMAKTLNSRNTVKETSSMETPNKIEKLGKQVPCFLPLSHKITVDPVPQILSPIENKMSDASLSTCQESICKIILERPNKLNIIENVTPDAMDVDSFHETKKFDLTRKDSNRELEEIEIQIKKIKSDTINNMEQRERFRKDEFTKSFKEKEEDSLVPRKPHKISNYVKKRRDYNQQFGSLITFPKRELPKRDPLIRRSMPIANRRKMSNSESLGGFDVFNIETAMPKIDLEAIECHLKAAKEEERRLKSANLFKIMLMQSVLDEDDPVCRHMIRKLQFEDAFRKRRTDREEIRRRLAMGNEDDFYTDRPGRKPSLQARLQSGMNLQICFMNETVSDNESPSSDNECSFTSPKPSKTLKQNANQNQSNFDNVAQPAQRPATLSLHPAPPPQLGGAAAETDFFTKQARLQTEARMALAQAKEMARMQMEIERQRQKKSPITEMVRHSLEKVGIPFPEEKRRLSRQILTEMNVAQLQVIVNDLHTQIETLNEQLVKFLMDRDDLHMEQDSMLVDIEDLTRYLGAKEQVLKEQLLAPTPQNNNLPPPSPAPSSPLTNLNNTVRPHLNRIASLVKK